MKAENAARTECLTCEMRAAIRARSCEVRRELQVMNPFTDPNYQGLYELLIRLDADLKPLYASGHQRADKADA